MKKSGETNSHTILKQTVEYQPLRLDSKSRAWGAVDSHNIPKGLKTLQKGSDAL